MTLASSVLFTAITLCSDPGAVAVAQGALHRCQGKSVVDPSDFLHVIFLLGLVLVISQGLRVVWTLPDPASWSMVVIGQALS